MDNRNNRDFVVTTVRLPLDVYDWLKQQGKKERRTISNFILYIVDHYREGQQEN